MKKALIIPFVLSLNYAYAGTGRGKDEIFFFLSITAVFFLIPAVFYTIDYTRKIIHQHREKKIAAAHPCNSETVN